MKNNTIAPTRTIRIMSGIKIKSYSILFSFVSFLFNSARACIESYVIHAKTVRKKLRRIGKIMFFFYLFFTSIY
jgi:hypothetical protein